MGHGIGSVPTLRTQLVTHPTRFAHSLATWRHSLLCRPALMDRNGASRADGLKMCFLLTAAPSVATKNRLADKLPLGQRAEGWLRECIVKAGGMLVNSLLNSR